MKKLFLQEGTAEVDARYLIGEDDSLELFFSKEKLAFVGIVVSNTKVIYCYPKYLPALDSKCDLARKQEGSIISHLQVLNRVFRKLSNQNRNIKNLVCSFNPAYIAGTEKKVDRYSLSKFIVEDYVKNGYLTSLERDEGPYNSGRINWVKTVSKINPVINGNQITYFQQIKQKWVNNPDEAIERVHESILYECLQEQQEFGNYLSLKVQKPQGLIKNYDQYIPTIKVALDQVYADREVHLLRALLTWCQKCHSRNFVSIGGTTDFENVWEWVNDYVFGNQGSKSSSNPLYSILGYKLRGKGEAKPDTLHCHSNETSVYIDIFDAKYYVPQKIITAKKFGEGIIEGFPASSDISKQIAYRLFIEQYCLQLNKSTNKGLVITNSFLVPSFNMQIIDILKEKHPDLKECTDLTREIGFVSIGEFGGLAKLFTLDKDKIDAITSNYFNNEKLMVKIIEVNPILLYQSFLKR